MNSLKTVLDQFFQQYSATQKLVTSFITTKTHPQEIVILLCSRMDALASGAVSEDEPSTKAFTNFVSTYSGKSKLFDSVSVGDVFYELDYHLWLLPGMLERAGRIKIFSQLNEPILKLLVDSEIPLTLRASQSFIKRVQKALRTRFQVAPNQLGKKKPLATANEIKKAVAEAFGGNRMGVSEPALMKAIDPLVSSKTLARILYQRFRCEAIHGGRVAIDDAKFFVETRRIAITGYPISDGLNGRFHRRIVRKFVFTGGHGALSIVGFKESLPEWFIWSLRWINSL